MARHAIRHNPCCVTSPKRRLSKLYRNSITFPFLFLHLPPSHETPLHIHCLHVAITTPGGGSWVYPYIKISPYRLPIQLKVGHTTAVHVPYSFWTVVCKAVLLKKIEGSPVLWTCDIQCAQHMISMKKLRFSSPLRITIRRHGPPGFARAQSWVWLLLTQWMFSLRVKQKD